MSNNKYSKTGLGLIGTNVMVGSIPNLSGLASETTLKSNFATGMSNTGKALPVMGKVKGTGMVLESFRGLKNSTKRLKLKGVKL